MRSTDVEASALREAVGRWRGKRVLVLGDMILDEFLLGRTDRVSREAPVVVVRYDRTTESPGGAANAAQNVASLGGAAVPIGLVGRDEYGARLTSLMRSRGMTARGIIGARGRLTTVKTRIMAGDFHAQLQQVVRIDRESGGAVGAAIEDRLCAALAREMPRAHAVLLSDYHEGIFTKRIIREALVHARRAGVPVVADSRFRLLDFAGVTTATPNEIEAAAAAGISLGDERALERIGRRLLRRLGASSLLVTRGKFGMTLFEPRVPPLSIPVVGSAEATDVTGAGDTVAAAVALSLAAGESMRTAMRLANAAASVVVMKRGTAVATPAEILDRLEPGA